VTGVAFVLGGGGMLGAAEVGMLRALLERGIRPDLVVGSSVGAVNGAFVAADPTPGGVGELASMWRDLSAADVFGGSLVRRLGTAVRTRTHLHGRGPLRRLLQQGLPVRTIEDLPVRFQCVAASIERAAEHWFSDGPLVDALVASCAVPGVFAPARVGDEHFYDGGLVNSIPMGRALALGASTVYVLHVGRIEQPLEPPSAPWEVGMVAFEIARRHRFASDLRSVPAEVTVHVLPAGEGAAPRYNDLRGLNYRAASALSARIEGAYTATSAYLDLHHEADADGEAGRR
jgi:NTE family protein